MTDTVEIVNALEQAEAQLREICERHDQFATPIDTGSLERMRVHIRNINRSISESTRDHVNAAKRLTDFSVTLGRMASRASPSGEEFATRLRQLAEILRTAGADLARAPAEQENWQEATAS